MEKERYEIVKLIGKGLVGGVYEAKDTVLSDRGVAIRRFFNVEEGTNRSDWEEGFLEVAQQLSGIQHPGIVTVFDVGVDDEGAFVVAQLLEGKTFGERLQRGAINEWDVYVTIEGILDALLVAHEAGFIHGSLDPSSIIRVPRASGGYRNVIVDLGLTRLARLIEGKESSSKLMAQPAMMAPEQFDGSAPTVTSDLYMLGQFAYMCLIGGHPFAEETMEEAAISHKEVELKRLEKYDNGVSKEFSDWVHSLIQKNPEDRPQSAKEALKSLPKLSKPIDANLQLTGPVINGPATSAVQISAAAHQTGAQVLQAATMATGPQALQATGAVATAPVSQLTGEQQIQPEPAVAAKKSNKPVLIAICSVLGLLLVGLLVLIVMQMKGPDDLLSSDDEAKPKQNTPVLDSTPKELSYTTSMDKALYEGKFYGHKVIARQKKAKVKTRTVTPNAKDYIVLNGVSLNDYRLKKTPADSYFSKVELNGNAKLHELLQASLLLAVEEGGDYLYPKVNISTANNVFNKDTGYKITGKIPEGHTGPLKLKFYVSLLRCGCNISFRYTGDDKLARQHNISHVAFGLYSSTLTVSDAYPGEEFEVLITVANPEANATNALTFHGILAL